MDSDYFSYIIMPDLELKPSIIALLGPVGSGKSTHIELLASRLRRRGLKVTVTTLKTGYPFAHALVYMLAKALAGHKTKVYPIRALLEEKSTLFRKLFGLWLTLEAFSVLIKFLLRIYIPAGMGRLVLVEDYLPATIADHLYLSKSLGLPYKPRKSFLNLMLKLTYSCEPLQLVFLDADLAELEQRGEKRGSLKEKPDYLHMQCTLLLCIAKKLCSSELIYINTTNRTVRETQDTLIYNLAVRFCI